MLKKDFNAIGRYAVEKLTTGTNWPVILAYMGVFCLLAGTGCSPPLSSDDQVGVFQQAGPATRADEEGHLAKTKNRTGPYQVVYGDLLELQMPSIFLVVSSDMSDSIQKIEPFLCRVSDAGTITLPIVGQMPAVGKTLSELELLIVNAYYPKYVVNRPVVVCRVEEYKNQDERVFAVMGLVNHPDAFPYPPNVQYNLMEALAFAGGFDLIADPRYVKIYRQNENGQVVHATFGIDNKSLNDAYAVLIKPGDVIYVDHTFRTRTNVFLSNVLSIGVGADVRYGR